MCVLQHVVRGQRGGVLCGPAWVRRCRRCTAPPAGPRPTGERHGHAAWVARASRSRPPYRWASPLARPSPHVIVVSRRRRGASPLWPHVAGESMPHACCSCNAQLRHGGRRRVCVASRGPARRCGRQRRRWCHDGTDRVAALPGRDISIQSHVRSLQSGGRWLCVPDPPVVGVHQHVRCRPWEAGAVLMQALGTPRSLRTGAAGVALLRRWLTQQLHSIDDGGWEHWPALRACALAQLDADVPSARAAGDDNAVGSSMSADFTRRGADRVAYTRATGERATSTSSSQHGVGGDRGAAASLASLTGSGASASSSRGGMFSLFG